MYCIVLHDNGVLFCIWFYSIAIAVALILFHVTAAFTMFVAL